MNIKRDFFLLFQFNTFLHKNNISCENTGHISFSIEQYDVNMSRAVFLKYHTDTNKIRKKILGNNFTNKLK